MKGKIIGALALAVCVVGFWMRVPQSLRAQDTGLKVVITRPGEGETLYASPTTPYVRAQVSGIVTGNDFDVLQLQVRLELLQGAQSFGTLTTTPKTDGTFSFDVAIDPELPATKSSGEYGCKSACHTGGAPGLPAGSVTLRVTVTDPLGRKASVDRSIVVDHSDYADLPVQVIADDSKKPIAGVNLVAATRLYLWRARQYSVKTDNQGRAVFHVEALGQAPTRYLLEIDPIILDGVRYTSTEPVTVTLAPGMRTAEMVTLTAQARRGQIAGVLETKSEVELTVRAINITSGAGYSTRAMQGTFSLDGLPLGKYLVGIDEGEAAKQGLQAPPQMCDTSASPVTSTTLKLVAAASRPVGGVVHDGNRVPLPFVWFASSPKGPANRGSPLSGRFAQYDLPSDAHMLWVTAPGYWSRPVALGDGLDITLMPQPETRFAPWGSGTITLPPQANASIAGDRLSLKRGWVWGRGTGPFSITTPDSEIAFQSGAFALEYMPEATSWLYLLDGQALVVVSDDDKISLTGKQMLSFGIGVPHPRAVPLDDISVRLLHSGGPSPIGIETDPALPARLRDQVESLGIPFPIAAVGAALLAVSAVVLSLWKAMRRRSAYPTG